MVTNICEGKTLLSGFIPDWTGVPTFAYTYLQFKDNDSSISLSSTATGESILSWSAPWGEGEAIYPGIAFWKDEPILFIIGVSPAENYVHVNGSNLKEFEAQFQQPYRKAEDPNNQGVLDYDAKNKGLSISERRFLQIGGQVASAIQSVDEHHIIAATGALRLLLLDKSALIHVVNRSRKVKIEFVITSNDPLRMDVRPPFYLRELYPHHGKSRCVSMAKFLAQPIIELSEITVSVLDLIRFASHYLGAHHFDSDPTEGPADQLMVLYETLRVQDMALLLFAMREILRVAELGLRPIAASLR